MPILYRRVILIAYLCFITTLFSLPASAFPKRSWLDDIWFDKWIHIGFFSVLCFLASWVWTRWDKKFYLILFFVAAAYGLFIEIIQDRYIPNRSLDLGDWIADMVGSLIGIFIWHFKTKGYAKK